MKNPYDVLGIPQNANGAQVREAYRALARTCAGNPRRMQELDDAYDAIILSKGGAGWASPGGNADFADIRQRIEAGRHDDAVMLLDGMPANQRNAEWHYLKGRAQRGRGWLEEATKNFARAARMEPGNMQYKAAHEQMQEDRSGRSKKQSENSGCAKLCGGLMCLNCLCQFCR